MAVPKQIRVEKAARRLLIAWDDGATLAYDFDALRKDCPCADCKGHVPSQAKKIECEGVQLKDIRQVGHYALNLVFDDGHDTGLYTYDYLRTQAPTVAPAEGGAS